uniref:Ferredoxin-dependent glutamate synthase n=1 Tax=Melanthalia intermedia TaxID=172989 RepID=A0A345UAK5_9FLOR|nr:glutamate synthase [Melanthalia intermedia]AXI97491.1 glutamate synthase [Melanthalia intermedia]
MQLSKYYNLKLNYLCGHPYIVSERDACGVGFVARINYSPSHDVIAQALNSLSCMEHRGGCSADGISGDGAGVMTQIPWRLFFNFLSSDQFHARDHIGVGMLFLPSEKLKNIAAIQKVVQWAIVVSNFEFIGWRSVPVNENLLGFQAGLNQPVIMQLFVKSELFTGAELERALYVVRKKIEKLISQVSLDFNKQFYFCSFSSRIIVYKGMLRSEVLGKYYKDLSDSRYESSFVLYHRRFSTNTMPKWSLAQPMRFIAHNGEINTLTGNLNWMQSKESLFQQSYHSDSYNVLKPITNSENSDSANLDSVLELLIQSGKSPQEALMILIPEAYKNQPALKNFPEITDFYEYYNNLQEPWDGPALVVFSDGKIVGATLDRNGLRPARYVITESGFVSLSSEVGSFNNDLGKVVQKGRLGPGQMLCVDMVNNLILDNWTVKQSIANKFPYKKWIDEYQQYLLKEDYLEDSSIDRLQMMRLHTVFGYTNEDVELVIEHMASSAKEPTFCMGDDIPLAILSERPHLLYDFFKQRFAQVTNPAIDSLRENLVMSLVTYLGSKGNFLDPADYMAKSIKLDSPIINEREILRIRNSNFLVSTIEIFFKQNSKSTSFLARINEICKEVIAYVTNGSEIIILSDRVSLSSKNYTFLPPLLIVGAVHHDLIAKNLRHKASIIVETAQCWSTHHFACLIGYGASAVCPYMAFLTVRQWWHNPRTQKLMSNFKLPSLTLQESQNNYCSAIEVGLLKILSKMGISLLSSYHGAQVFEILGLAKDVVALAFRGTISFLEGITLNELALSCCANTLSFSLPKKLPNLGYVQYRPSAEYHVNNPEMSKTLHKAVRNKSSKLYYAYKNLLEDRPPTNLRDLLDFTSSNNSISVDEVESTESIMKRFCTGGMSLGALSRETHETLAVAMNRIGGKSNSGEGGEDPSRFKAISDIDASGISTCFSHLKGLKINDISSSAIKQIASGRFGVTPEYLMSAKQLEIKIAQGAKPGEGGQLPGKKVSPYIAQLRNCKPGVTLISPPPHHDIYSIEDLAQLIFDLHQINPDAKVSVKLVAEAGIGTIAAGVVKANADIIQISGHDGGTGASPLSSIKHAGSPWELGLTEVHKTLTENSLRARVTLRVDGGLRTGKDVVIAALMGAEEFGFGTVAMIATGCVMARICHTNNCPVGVATQRQDLRKRYPGIPADLVNFFIFIAQETRQILAFLGFKTLGDIIGLNQLLVSKNTSLIKTGNISLASLLNVAQSPLLINSSSPPHTNGHVLDNVLLNDSEIIHAIEHQGDIVKEINVINSDRAVGARISGTITKKYGNNGFQGSLQLNFKGVAGQSFGAFVSKGMHLNLIGEANDYVAKGMNGGEIIISPHLAEAVNASSQVIIGNTCLYGATGGYLFVNGQAGERFAVRNSFAQAVVEGVGDHACEYMTGGVVVVLGSAGRNIGAGMTGGLSYFLDEENNLASKINYQIVKVQRVLTKEAEKQLKNLIELYEIKTKSIKAKRILENWLSFLPIFWQIVPPSEEATALTSISNSSYQTMIN